MVFQKTIWRLLLRVALKMDEMILGLQKNLSMRNEITTKTSFEKKLFQSKTIPPNSYVYLCKNLFSFLVFDPSDVDHKHV